MQPGRDALRLIRVTTTDISLSTLDGANYARLRTFRRNGQSVPTTIWFALGDGKAYLVTGPGTGKAKRMRGTPRVLLGALSTCLAQARLEAASGASPPGRPRLSAERMTE